MPKKKQREETRGRGRPTVSAEVRKSVPLVIRISEADKELMEEVAEGNVSKWARDVLIRAAKRQRK